MLTNFQVGDFVHFIKNPKAIYEVEQIYPYWYKGKNHIKLRNISCHNGYPQLTSDDKIVVTEPELLL